MECEISPHEFFDRLGEALESKRAIFKRELKLRFALAEGERYVVDLSLPKIASAGWSDSADVSVLTNAITLSDWAMGRFDAKQPRPEHVFLCSGDREAFRALEQVLIGGQGMIALRAQAPTPRTKPKRPRLT